MPEVPDTLTPAEARTAAKSKDPMNKFRLIVATQKTPTTFMSKVSAAAAEFVVDLAQKDGCTEVRTVDSLRSATEAITRMQHHIRAAAEKGHCQWTVRKYDFVAFF